MISKKWSPNNFFPSPVFALGLLNVGYLNCTLWHKMGCIFSPLLLDTFILFERKIFVVSVSFCLIKIHWVVPEI